MRRRRASSLPVVVNDKEPLPEVLGGCGVVAENKPEAFAWVFEELIENAEYNLNANDIRELLKDKTPLTPEQKLEAAKRYIQESNVSFDIADETPRYSRASSFVSATLPFSLTFMAK